MEEVEQLLAGVIIGEMHPLMQESIEKTPDAIPMILTKNKRIKEHTHGDSMYFAKNVKYVTVNGKKHPLPGKFSWVFIPAGLSHGWSDTLTNEKGIIHSYHPDHDDITLLPAN